MSVLVDVHILNDKTFSVSDIWKVIINLLNISVISFTARVTASHPKHRRWSLHLSAGQCTGSSCTSNSGAASSWDTQIHCSRHVTAQQPGHYTGWLLHLGRDAGTSLPHANTGWGRSAAEGDELLSWLPDNCSWRSKWQKRLDACLRAQGGHFEHCFDTACRVFHDCIKRVKSVTYLTSSYSCKRIKNCELRISQRNVVTVLRRGGQKI